MHRSIIISVCCLFGNYGLVIAQEETIPDGTSGERLEVVDSDSLPEIWRDKRWRLFNGRFTTFKMGGGFLYEFADFEQDENGKIQSDSLAFPLESTFSVRDFRLLASGQLKTKRTISWRIGYMYDDDSKEWYVRESGVMINFPKIHSNFFIGRTKEGYSFNKVMNGYSGWTLERQMGIDVIPILADGIKWMAFLPKQKIFWNLGAFGDWLSKYQSFSTFRMQFVLRTGWLPIFDEGDKKYLHLGVNYRYGLPEEGKINLRSRPEVNEAPFFIETGTFLSDYSQHIGFEFYYQFKKILIGSEIHRHTFHSNIENQYSFYGGDVVVSYMISGERRPYHSQTSIFGFVPVSKSFFKGGPGAWEILCRFSSLDLNDKSLQGGEFRRITPMVNWYLSKELRLEFAYGYGVLNRFGIKGSTNFFQCRLQMTLL